MAERRVIFDFEVDFSNGGGIQGHLGRGRASPLQPGVLAKRRPAGQGQGHRRSNNSPLVHHESLAGRLIAIPNRQNAQDNSPKALGRLTESPV